MNLTHLFLSPNNALFSLNSPRVTICCYNVISVKNMKTIKPKNKLAVIFSHLDHHDEMIYYLDIGCWEEIYIQQH